MFWRTSKTCIDNSPFAGGQLTIELYKTEDDYAHFLKYEEGDRNYPWCIMRPFGTKAGAEIVTRFSTFTEAYNGLQGYE